MTIQDVFSGRMFRRAISLLRNAELVIDQAAETLRDRALWTGGCAQKNLLGLLQDRAVRDKANYHRHFHDFGFREFSEYEEDGLILHLFAGIGFTSRTVVEICAGDGKTCMATNLIVNHGFDGLLFDGSHENVATGDAFFRRLRDTRQLPPKFLQAWITRENVNDLISQAGFGGEVDLLSIDIDGNDYWVWEAISVINPRVCVFETHNVIPSHLSLTIPYDPAFYCWDKPANVRDFRSVSLLAMTKLSRQKGYRLVGGHRHGFNAFFMRDDVAEGIFPPVTVESVHANRSTRLAQTERWPVVQNLGWQKV